MLQQTSTTLLALSYSLQNQSLLQMLNHLKMQIINRVPINTKESVINEADLFKPSFLLFSSSLAGAVDPQDVILKTKQLSPKTKIVVVVTEQDSATLVNYLLAGADGIIYAENISDSLEVLVKQLNKGFNFICGRSVTEMKKSLQSQKTDEKTNTGLLNLLTERETEVLFSLTQGINYKQIAKLLFISESTVKTHINNIFTKLNVNDRTQAVLYALHHGIESLLNKPQLIKDVTSESVKK